MESIEQKKEYIIRVLREKSYKRRIDPPFTLASGRLSEHYVDCKPTTYNSEAITCIGEMVFELIKDLDVTAIGGLTMGADPISIATAVISHQKGKTLNAFSVRKKQKDHGTKKLVEGDVSKGDNVVIVDDVITTGGSTIQAIDAARDFGLKVSKVVVLVDRQEGGKEAIQEKVLDVESIVTLRELSNLGRFY